MIVVRTSNSIKGALEYNCGRQIYTECFPSIHSQRADHVSIFRVSYQILLLLGIGQKATFAKKFVHTSEAGHNLFIAHVLVLL